jgi:hypothetical protein
MPIDPRISLGVQPLQIADPLAQYGQVQNILASQAQQRSAGTQQQAAELQLQQAQRQIQQDEDYVTKMAEAIGKNGGPSDMMQAARVMSGNRNPQVSATGIQMLQSLQRLDAAKKAGVYGTVAPTAMPSVAPASGALGSGTFDPNAPVAAPMPTQAQRFAGSMGTNLPPTGAANQLAPASVAPVNKLVDNTAALRAEYARLSEYEDLPGIKDRMDLIKDRLKESSKKYVVGRNLLSDTGEVIFNAPPDITPSEIKRLTTERDALPLTDPNRKLYDQAIANLGSTERLAQERLNFDRNKFAWEKANPGYTIQQAEDGSIVGVNNRSLQAFPVNLNATPPPVAAPFGGGGARAPGGAGKRGGVVAPAAEPIIQPRGEPLKGKSAGLTEGQGNAAMFGSAMAQAQQVFDKVEKEGTTTGAVATNLAQGIVKYVPLGVGDKLVNDIYALAVNDPTKLFGPDVNQQKLGQAQLAFSIAYLRKTSGAMFGPSEVANTIMEYFPAIGESASVVKQKAESRKRAIAGMKMSAGREGAKFIEQYESPSGGTSSTSASDPLGLFPAKKP